MRCQPPLIVAACLVAAVIVFTSGCKDSGSWLFSMDDEVELGRDAAAEFEQTNPVSRDPALNRLVKGIGADIAAVARPPSYPYEFRVIDTNTVNAVAFPGGRIYMYRGLIQKLGRDRDMIAWVLGHEVTHVSLRHAAKRIEKQVGIAAITELLLGESTARDVATVVADLMFRDYGRDKEFQADARGLVYAHNAGYDATAAIGVIKVFQSLHGGKDPDKLELLFMTHPGDNRRLNQIKRLCARYGYTGRYYP